MTETGQAVRRRMALLTLVVLWSANGATGQAGNAIILETPPGELAELRAEGMVLMDASEDGKELFFLPLATGVVHTFLESQGKDLARSAGNKPMPLRSESFDYQPVIRDIAWDRREHRLLVLLAAGVVGETAPLDVLDAATGELRRVALRFPSGAEPQSLGQVVAGHDYLWFRNLVGRNPIYRLDRARLFDKGERLTLPEISLFESWEERETVEDVVAPAEER